MLSVGIYDGVSMDDYLAMRGFSASKARTLLKYSPFHAFHGVKSGPSEVSETGTAIHDALLEGVDRIVRIDADSWRTKAAKEARDMARAEGRIPLLAHKVANVEAAVKAAKAHIAASPLAGIFERGKPEVTVVAEDDGVTLKIRPDWMTNNLDTVLHVKSTKGSAHPEAWARTQLEPMGYDVAAAFYERVLNGHPQSVFLVIEQSPPHGCSLVAMSPLMAQIAAGKVERAIRTWRECRREDRYPAYPVSITYAEPKSWNVEQAMESGDLDNLSFEERIELGGQA